jgi:hypothetical protein
LPTAPNSRIPPRPSGSFSALLESDNENIGCAEDRAAPIVRAENDYQDLFMIDRAVCG